MELCQWCWKEIGKSEVPGWHDYCIVAMADFFDHLETNTDFYGEDDD